MARAIFVVGCFTLFAGGCTDINSTDLKTAGMSAHMLVSADGSGASQVSVTLNVDTNLTDFVQLEGGDKLTATAASTTEQLTETDLLGDVSYGASFSGPAAQGETLYTIAFTRAAETSAPQSTCTLPDPFAVLAPDGGVAYPRDGGAVVVTWSPSGTSDRMLLSANGDCIELYSQPIDGDPGTATIPAGAFTASPIAIPAASCQVTVELTRQRSGSLDPAFGYGGDITAEQNRQAVFLSTP